MNTLDRDGLPVKIDVLVVGTIRNQDGVSVVRRIDGSLDCRLIGWNMNGRRRNGASNQTG